MEDLDFGEVVQAMFAYKMEDIYTALPGIVLKVHDSGETLLVDIQPSVSVLTKTEEIFHRPVVLNVPVQMPASNKAGFLFPVDVGDTMLMVFSQDAIDNFKYGDGKPTAPNDYRRYNVRDCVAIPGVFPKAGSVNRIARHKLKHSPRDIVMFHNLGTGAECEVRLKDGTGDIEVTTPKTFTLTCKDMLVNASNGITLTAKTFKANTPTFTVSSTTYSISTGSYSMNATTNATSTGTFSHNGNWTLNGIVMNTHTHGGVQTGGGSTGGPQ